MRPAHAIIWAVACLCLCPGLGAGAKKQADSTELRESDLPPIVLMGGGRLDCTISSTANGRQQLSLTAGSGVHFDVAVTPILDGVIELKNGRLSSKTNALNYRFTSHLAKTSSFRVTGFTRTQLVHLETRVSVNAKRYRQDAGPGTAVSFSSEDMDSQGVYIEFRGIFRDLETNRRFSFRTLMGPPTDGSGQVTPLDSNDTSRIVAKTVMVENLPKPGKAYTQIITTLREMDEK